LLRWRTVTQHFTQNLPGALDIAHLSVSAREVELGLGAVPFVQKIELVPKCARARGIGAMRRAIDVEFE
jgi:hypothetical protein